MRPITDTDIRLVIIPVTRYPFVNLAISPHPEVRWCHATATVTRMHTGQHAIQWANDV